MSENRQTIILREYTSMYPDVLERFINDELERIRAEGIRVQRLFVKMDQLPGNHERTAYLIAYVQRPKPKQDQPPTSHASVLPDAVTVTWLSDVDAGQLSV